MPNTETIAAAIHETWRALSKAQGWKMQPRLDRDYADLAEADKDDNRAAAGRMGSVLAVAGLGLSDDPAAQGTVIPASAMEPMAEAEHDGWLAHRAATGWSYAPTRDDAAKQHPSLIPYAQLPESEKEKDRNNIRHYADFAARAGYKITRHSAI